MEKKPIALKFLRKQGDRVVYLLPYEKNKSIKFQTFASQRLIKFKQFLTRPNLACSVAKNDRRFFFGFDIPRNHFKLISISEPI